MIGIKAIGEYIPNDSVDNIVQALSFSESEDFIKNKIGAIRLTRKLPEEDTSDMAVKALNSLCQQSGLERSAIQALLVVTQNPDGTGLPHTAAIVQEKAGLSTSCAAFDVSLGCSGYVYGLSILKGFMESSNLKNGVLITCDPYSKIIDTSDRVTTLLFGDAATATWLGDGAEWDIGTPLFGTDGSGADHLAVQDGFLKMNGRQVFNFAAMRVPAEIKAYLDSEGLESNEVDVYCLHQGSAAIIDAISRRFPEVKDRFIIEIEETGNTVSSSIPLLLRSVLIDENNRQVLISGFGVGLSWATTILRRSK